MFRLTSQKKKHTTLIWPSALQSTVLLLVHNVSFSTYGTLITFHKSGVSSIFGRKIHVAHCLVNRSNKKREKELSKINLGSFFPRQRKGPISLKITDQSYMICSSLLHLSLRRVDPHSLDSGDFISLASTLSPDSSDL